MSNENNNLLILIAGGINHSCWIAVNKFVFGNVFNSWHRWLSSLFWKLMKLSSIRIIWKWRWRLIVRCIKFLNQFPISERHVLFFHCKDCADDMFGLFGDRWDWHHFFWDGYSTHPFSDHQYHGYHSNESISLKNVQNNKVLQNFCWKPFKLPKTHLNFVYFCISEYNLEIILDFEKQKCNITIISYFDISKVFEFWMRTQ